jgi:hypothetical protein
MRASPQGAFEAERPGVAVAMPASTGELLGLDIAIRGLLARMAARRNCSRIDPRVLADRARSNWPFHDSA